MKSFKNGCFMAPLKYVVDLFAVVKLIQKTGEET